MNLRLLGREQRLAHRDLLVGEDRGRVVGAPVQRVDRGDDLHRVALGDRLALLAGEQLGDVVDLVDQHVGGAAHVAGAVVQRELRPERLDLGDLGDDAVDVPGVDRLDRADQLAGGGVEGLELPHRRGILWPRHGGRGRASARRPRPPPPSGGRRARRRAGAAPRPRRRRERPLPAARPPRPRAAGSPAFTPRAPLHAARPHRQPLVRGRAGRLPRTRRPSRRPTAGSAAWLDVGRRRDGRTAGAHGPRRLLAGRGDVLRDGPRARPPVPGGDRRALLLRPDASRAGSPTSRGRAELPVYHSHGVAGPDHRASSSAAPARELLAGHGRPHLPRAPRRPHHRPARASTSMRELVRRRPRRRRPVAVLGESLDGPASRAVLDASAISQRAQLGLEAPVGGLVEALALDLLGQQRLVGDAAGLVVRVDVALAAAELLRRPGSGRRAGSPAAASRRARGRGAWPPPSPCTRRSTSAPAPGRRPPGRG